MRGFFAILLSCVGLSGCAPPSQERRSELPILEPYPQTINAISASGRLERSDGCISFIRSDGARFVPLFRSEAALAELQNLLGPLDTPAEVTVSGYTILKPVPESISSELDERNCDGTPMVYGTIRLGNMMPSAPQT